MSAVDHLSSPEVSRALGQFPSLGALPRIIGLHGPAGVGEDFVGAMMVAGSGGAYKCVAFADGVRDAALALDPLVITDGGLLLRLSSLVERIGWDRAKRESLEVRRTLERIGTEVARDMFGKDVWVDWAFASVSPVGRAVVTDVRFENEAEAVLERGGWVIRILGQEEELEGAHRSRIPLPDDLVTATFDNRHDGSGSLESVLTSANSWVDFLWRTSWESPVLGGGV